MKKQELNKNLIFYFKKYPTEDYIITSFNENTVNYKSLSGAHTFTAGCLIEHFLNITEKTVIKHVQV